MSPPNPSPTSVKGEGVEEEGVEKKEEEKQVEKKGGGEKAAEKGSASVPSPIPSINHFIDLNVALSEFVRQWDGLLRFIDSIGASIDARSKELGTFQTSDGEKMATAAVKEEAKSSQEKASLDEPRAELHSICQKMSSRFLRKFVTIHDSEIDWLRREVPAALQRAPNPAQLVFDSIGRFYLQGRKAYDRNPTAIVGRRACILILEFYVLSGLPSEAESSLKQDAMVAALAWRSRLVAEGGVADATAADALGLALFVASFGIPNDFGCDVMYDLLRLSNLKKKADVFQQSPILREKIPGIIKELISKDMHVEAVRLACAFRLEEKFPPIPLLSSVLQKSLQTANEGKREGQSLEAAHEKQLSVLKSVAICVKDNKLDPSEIASFNLYQKIASLEKDIAKGKQILENKNFKRKAEFRPLNQPETQVKRPWPAPVEIPPGVTPHLTMQAQERRSPALSDTKGLYNGPILQSIHDGGFNGSHYRSGMELLTGGVHGSAGVGASFQPGARSDSAGSTLRNNVGFYANISGGSYGWRQDGALDGRSVAKSSGFASSAGWMDPSAAAPQSLYQPQASSLGIETTSSRSDLYHFADIVLERESDYDSSKSNVMPSATNPSRYSSYLS